jgi:transcriptional regulator with GAF, ATPase, and Fis domain
LVSELVQYLKANQGGVFVINNEDLSDQYLDLVGCYAWDRVKFLEQHIREGDGLVGQVWQERHTLYITDVPSDYVKIVSGLGTANPKCILIVPMIVNEEIFGVIEIASFTEFEEHQIRFVEKVAETTASTISTVKVNQRTKQLLAQAQKATERMRAHDDALRHNQVEMSMAQKELKSMIEELQGKLHDSKFDRNELKEENEILQNVLLKTSKELERYKIQD